MSADSLADAQERLAQVKREIKTYERAFQAEHGRPAEREEIKRDATIWKKYVEYKELQRQLSKTRSPRREKPEPKPMSDHGRILKERRANNVSATPQRRSRVEDKLEKPAPVVQEVEQTPACIRFALGPTPQKDGEVLGIFDMLPSATPSKGKDVSAQETAQVVGATPSKPSASASSDPLLSRTPQSSSKRYYLGAFAGTPLKRKCEDHLYTPNTAKRQYATPSFLRRDTSLISIPEDDNDTAMFPPPFKKRGLVRSLSTIIQGLKKQEEKRMDDDWDIMDEIEAEERGEAPKPAAPKVLVEDSQVEMPLGPDQGAESSEDEGKGDRGALDADGRPRKVWKKKGLKRQTRRVVMRPVVHKPGKAVPVEEDAEESADEVVGETQPAEFAKDDARDGDGDAEWAEEAGEEALTEKIRKDVKSRQAAKKKAALKPMEDDRGKKAKKGKPDAHTNYRRLNIKNKNSKAKGRGGRFGRR
ncbi:uncharacterized protein LTR77_006458 [Saxophila tyrrhenica]|uniref:DNA replication regulator SLD2 n=1 Tax=Saxophila tyrrhenica TaxID=1690608 RepID=A0AAV9PBE7_9PEZI|nr:hypothetical protein LTR77_006458 [Saxophila tyrrhenica]